MHSHQEQPTPFQQARCLADRCVTRTSVRRIPCDPFRRLRALARLVCTTASIADWVAVVSSSACGVRFQTQSAQSLQQEAAGEWRFCLLQQHSGPQLRHPLKLTPLGSAPANYRTFPVAGPWVILSCVRCFRFSSRSPMHSHVRRLGDSACACCTGGGT